jgi:hypothetical protein
MEVPPESSDGRQTPGVVWHGEELDRHGSTNPVPTTDGSIIAAHSRRRAVLAKARQLVGRLLQGRPQVVSEIDLAAGDNNAVPSPDADALIVRPVDPDTDPTTLNLGARVSRWFEAVIQLRTLGNGRPVVRSVAFVMVLGGVIGAAVVLSVLNMFTWLGGTFVLALMMLGLWYVGR